MSVIEDKKHSFKDIYINNIIKKYFNKFRYVVEWSSPSFKPYKKSYKFKILQPRKSIQGV